MSQIATWMERIRAAAKHQKRWREKFSVAALFQYYEGNQWAESTGYTPYVLNLFAATLDAKIPTLIFNNPKFNVVPKPKSLETDPEEAFQISLNLEDTLNYWVSDSENEFNDEVKSAIFDAWFGFGIIEVGYSADWIDNPRASKPVIRSDFRSNNTTSRDIVTQPPRVPVNERVYTKYIPLENFIVSSRQARYLHRCDWCGYFEYIRVKDLKAHPQIRTKLKNFSFTGASVDSPAPEEEFEEDEEFKMLLRSGEYLPVWKIWDTRRKKRLLITDLHEEVLLETSYDIFPFVDLRLHIPRKGFYPVPPTYNWVHPQNEVNEIREAHRAHRRRFKRIYSIMRGAVESIDEVEKAINGPDGSVFETSVRDPLMPVPNADLGRSADITLQTSYSDFNIVSGTTPEQRLEAKTITATQAQITNQRANIRESAEQTIIANFYIRIAKKVLLFIKNRFVNTITIPETEPRNEGLLDNLNTTKRVRTINPFTDFGDDSFDFDVNVSVESMSPVANQAELEKFLSFLALLKQYPEISLNPILIRELAARTGYRNERVIQAFQQIAQVNLIGQVFNATTHQGSTVAQNRVEAMTPPDEARIVEQLRGQGIPIGEQ